VPAAAGLRFASDWRSTRTARRFMWTGICTPNAVTAGSNIMGIRKTAGNPDVFISRVRVHVTNAAAAAAAPLGWKRATSVANGTQVALADLPEVDSATSTATLEVRQTTGAGGNTVGGTKANQYILTHPAQQVLTSGMGGGMWDDWTARDVSERIRLTGDEGLILDFVTAGDADMRIHVMLVWEEVS
jgi:hypothetical protein